MASSEHRYCDICSNNHVVQYATVCCPECDESFCKKCKTHHDVANATKKHETISIENALRLPQFVQEIKYKCTDHNERFVKFCYTHERPCCIECLQDKLHSGCCCFVNVDTAVKDVKQSPSFLDLQTTLSDLLTNISNIIEHIGANLLDLSKQKVTCAEEIRSTREAINSYLDQLEQDLNNKMQETFTSKELELQNVLADLELRKTKVNEMQANVNVIRDAASNFQTFMSIPEYIKPAHSEETVLQSLCENESFNWNSISVISTNIQLIRDNLTSFGTMRIKRKASNLSMKVQKSRQAQLTATDFVSKRIETMEFKEVFQSQIQDNMGRHEILDCGILPNGDLLFSDRNNTCLYKFDTKSASVKIDLPFFPARFAIVDQNSIAVTSNNKLHIVELDTHNIFKTFHFGKESLFGSVIIYDNNYIIEDLVGYQIIDSDGKSIQQIRIKFDEMTYRAPVCYDKKIYFVDNKRSKLFCYDFDGNQIWEFQNKKLASPYGLTSNNSNILFVCGYRSTNVCALSADGKTFKEIIGPKSELKCATAVHYCFVREIKYKCTDHNERFVYFCYTHERPCCIECLKDKLHSGFCSSVNVDTAVKHVKQSASFLDLKITLSDLLTNLSRIIEHIGANLQELSKQKVTCADEIRLARESINSYLDQLEKDLSNTMEETLTSKELELQNVLADLELRKTRVNEMHADVNIIKDAASNFQTFMSIPKYIKPAHSQENALQSLCETESFNWSSILVNPTSIQAIKDNLTSFGTVRVKRNACNIGMKVQKSRQAQLTATGFFSKTIETMEFKKYIKNQIQDGHDILDCGILPNGDLLFQIGARSV
ncbi:unnamed protein product [Mytilus edulis]|uniref:B box-type domain-containing protein n=1 Tax=Mytilus edulis TaxID=6550 RepID=A0A8S3T6T3_MYTED|nr:unnamed protein product [Mytilus edulis]